MGALLRGQEPGWQTAVFVETSETQGLSYRWVIPADCPTRRLTRPDLGSLSLGAAILQT